MCSMDAVWEDIVFLKLQYLVEETKSLYTNMCFIHTQSQKAFLEETITYDKKQAIK